MLLPSTTAQVSGETAGSAAVAADFPRHAGAADRVATATRAARTRLRTDPGTERNEGITAEYSLTPLSTSQLVTTSSTLPHQGEPCRTKEHPESTLSHLVVAPCR